MSVAKAEILEAISSMTVLELSQLIKDMEEKFGVSAAAAAEIAPNRQPRFAERTVFVCWFQRLLLWEMRFALVLIVVPRWRVWLLGPW